MKYKILLFGLIAAMFTGCSSVYRAGQTPDDVYYSPAKEGATKATAKRDKYEEYVSSQDDRYLRMKVRDRDRWSMIDDYSYWNDSRYVPYYNYNHYRNNIYNQFAWNNWYSPYGFSPYGISLSYNWNSGYYYNPNFMYSGYYGYGGYSPYSNFYISKNPTRTSTNVNRPNLNAYRNNQYSNRNADYNNNNTNREGFGNTLRRAITPTDSYNNSNRTSNNNTYSAPARTYTPSSSGSSGGAVVRPPK